MFEIILKTLVNCWKAKENSNIFEHAGLEEVDEIYMYKNLSSTVHQPYQIKFAGFLHSQSRISQTD